MESERPLKRLRLRGRLKRILKELGWKTVDWTNLDLVKTCDGLLISVGFP